MTREKDREREELTRLQLSAGTHSRKEDDTKCVIVEKNRGKNEIIKLYCMLGKTHKFLLLLRG